VAVIVDSSVWIDEISGQTFWEFEKALADGTLVLSPLAVAEVLSGDMTPPQRAKVGEMLQDFAVHATPLAHWLAVGDLRRFLRSKGINATIPDAHLAQCALERDAVLLSRDEIFVRIARHVPLRLSPLR
jgi:predicted nucleic acid-binding protein